MNTSKRRICELLGSTIRIGDVTILAAISFQQEYLVGDDIKVRPVDLILAKSRFATTGKEYSLHGVDILGEQVFIRLYSDERTALTEYAQFVSHIALSGALRVSLAGNVLNITAKIL